MPASPTVASLEQKYIELLERKIARLEIAESDAKSKIKPLAKKSSNSSMTAVNGDDSEPAKDKAVTTQTEPATKGAETTSRIRFRERKFTKEGLLQEEDTTSIPTKSETSKPQSTKHAMTVLRAFDEKEKYAYSHITIVDDGLRALLLHALSHRPGFSHVGTVVFVSLFEPIIHNWAALNEIASNDKSKAAVAGLHQEVISADSTSPLAPLKGNNMIEKATSDLKLLLEQVKDTPRLDSYFSEIRGMQENAGTIPFDYLWTIFPPGELVLSRTYMSQPQVFVVKHSSHYIDERVRTNDRSWSFECWSYDWNGTTFTRVPVEFTFEDFKGTKAISSLHCYPLRYHREDTEDDRDGADRSQNIRQALIKRGKRYRELCLKERGKQIFEYDGVALSRGTGVRKVNKANLDDDPDGWSSSGQSSNRAQSEHTQPKKQMIKTDRVMVDFNSYLQHGPPFIKFPPMGELQFVDDDDGACKCGMCLSNEKLKDNQKLHYDRVKPGDEWEDTQYLICPPRVLGYHLKGKRWVELDVEAVTDISNLEDRSSFDSLELAKPQKRLIEDLVRCHASGKDNKDRSMTDFMQGKGNGLVILLHGPPGVGKTLTAESVAKATGKPLFAVSVSDIGLKPAEVEHNLEVLFELAATWRAVMLFDEADVFLESRSSNTSNLDRNALVSVLLRVLEYYDGILILTTNRIRTFDIAVQSRINFAITYRNLTNDQKSKIYHNFIKQLDEEHTHDHQALLNWPKVEDWAEESPFDKLNGRQIRNVLFSAASIAQGDPHDKRLRKDHIKRILNETNKFQNEINSMIEVARREAEIGFDNH